MGGQAAPEARGAEGYVAEGVVSSIGVANHKGAPPPAAAGAPEPAGGPDPGEGPEPADAEPVDDEHGAAPAPLVAAAVRGRSRRLPTTTVEAFDGCSIRAYEPLIEGRRPFVEAKLPAGVRFAMLGEEPRNSRRRNWDPGLRSKEKAWQECKERLGRATESRVVPAQCEWYGPFRCIVMCFWELKWRCNEGSRLWTRTLHGAPNLCKELRCGHRHARARSSDR